MVVDAGSGLLSELLIDAAVTIELLSAGLRALRNGDEVTMPVSKEHAGAMSLLADAYLSRVPSPASNGET